MEQDQLELLTKAQEGDERALSELLESHAPLVRSRIAENIPARWQAVFTVDDVMQQAYLDAFLGIRSFRPRGEGSFTAWLTTLARHNLLDTIKGLEAEKRGGQRRQIVARDSDESFVALYEWLGAITTTPSRVAAKDEAKSALTSAMTRLPDAYRRVIEEYDLNGRTIEEVAAALGRTTGATYMLRARAHRALAELLGTASQFLTRIA